MQVEPLRSQMDTALGSLVRSCQSFREIPLRE